MRLDRVTTAMCPRLHVDRVTARIVVTYVGAGTEYVPSEHVDRRWLGHAACGAPDAESGLLLPGASVRCCAAGDVILLKGEAWPGHEGRGAVHRSPDCSARSPRLVMTLDPLFGGALVGHGGR
ncbi:DUF1826 domain-containing protein [Chondromyces crocatus]|uniref:Succinylglutamate desuccinylase n=1 Tax=Chondromyces crocatus TaxID=52 RepID=A0A0K1EDN5_CHOCO|nr:DUF1826 domain-containing protein [Chondromyces crocatus]AKT38986.1 succinylglutamate desuccinylase [Chondromyces crocatus]